MAVITTTSSSKGATGGMMDTSGTDTASALPNNGLSTPILPSSQLPSSSSGGFFATNPVKPANVTVPSVQVASSIERTSKLSADDIAYYKKSTGIDVKTDADLEQAEAIMMKRYLANTAPTYSNLTKKPELPSQQVNPLDKPTVDEQNKQIAANKKDLGCGVFPGCSVCSYLNYNVDASGFLSELDPNKWINKLTSLISDVLSDNIIANTLKSLLQCTVYISKSRTVVTAATLATAARHGRGALVGAIAEMVLPESLRNYGFDANILAANMQQNIQSVNQFNTTCELFGINPNAVFLTSIPGMPNIPGIDMRAVWASSSNGTFLSDTLTSPDITSMALMGRDLFGPLDNSKYMTDPVAASSIFNPPSSSRYSNPVAAVGGTNNKYVL